MNYKCRDCKYFSNSVTEYPCIRCITTTDKPLFLFKETQKTSFNMTIKGVKDFKVIYTDDGIDLTISC